MNADEEQEREDEDDGDPYEDHDVGPHTHVLVGTDDGDECEICGWQADPFFGIGEEIELGGEG